MRWLWGWAVWLLALGGCVRAEGDFVLIKIEQRDVVRGAGAAGETPALPNSGATAQRGGRDARTPQQEVSDAVRDD